MCINLRIFFRYDGSFQRSWLQDMRDDKFSRELIVEWSYSTAGSEGAGYAGKLSDVFLIPTIQILYKETQTVSFELSTCTASVSTSTKFDVGNAENKKSISFLTYRQVITETIPELETQLKQLNSSQNVERQTVTASISGWNEALAEYEQVNEKAWNGNLTSKVEDWMSLLSNHDIHCQIGWRLIYGVSYRCKPYNLSPNLCDVCRDFEGDYYCNELTTTQSCIDNWDTDFDVNWYISWRDLPKDHP